MTGLRERTRGGANAEEPVGTRGARPEESDGIGESACDSRDLLPAMLRSTPRRSDMRREQAASRKR